MKTFIRYILEAFAPGGYVSAIHWKGKIYHGHGVDHPEITSHIIDHKHATMSELDHHDETSWLGWYHRKDKKFHSLNGQQIHPKQEDVIETHSEKK